MAELGDTNVTHRGADASGFMLQRGDGIAAWRQIADEIERDIAEGRFRQGEPLPGEMQLASRFDVNRHTVRRAIASMAVRGLVRATKGRGTYVESRPIPYSIGAHTRFSEIATREGLVPGAELLQSAEQQATAEIAEALAIQADAPILSVQTRRFTNSVPVCLSRSYLPLPRFSGFVDAFRASGSISAALSACGVADYRRRETRISARIAIEHEASRLDLAPGRVLLSVNSVNVDPAGVPVQYTQALFAADRMELVVES